MALDDASAFDDLWDFGDPEGTERAFRSLLADGRVAAAPALGIEIETQIARTLGLRRRFDEARAVLEAARARLEAADPDAPGMGRARVRWLLEAGRTEASAIHSDDPAAAMARFEAALTLARALGEERLAVDAAHMAAIVAPEVDAQLRWNREALALAESAADPKARRWTASALNNLGMAYHAAGRYDEALHAFERALAEREAAGSADAVAVARWMIAWTLRALARHEEALAILRRLAADAAARGAPDGFVHEELAENLLATGDEPAARAAFAEALRLLRDDPGVRAQPERLARMRRLAGGEAGDEAGGEAEDDALRPGAEDHERSDGEGLGR